jgi:tetratricopeptide (TPR) repeat protein
MLRFVILLSVCLSLAIDAHADELFKQCTSTQESDAKIAFCTQLIESGDRVPIGYFNRGMAYVDKKDYNNAIADLDKGLELDSNMSYALFKRAVAHKALGNKDKALSDLTKAIDMDPEVYEAFKVRGDMRFEAGDRAGALADYSGAIDSSNALGLPDADLYCARSAVYVANGQKQEAEADYRAAEQITEQEGYCD